MKNQGWIKWVAVSVFVGIVAAGPVALAQSSSESDWLTSESFEKFVDRTKQPVEWLKWGADARLREVWGNNLTTLNKDTPGHEMHFQRYRFRIWATAKPHKDIDLNARLVFEPRYYCKPDAVEEWRYDEAIFDRLNVTWRNPFGVPVTATLGRQDIILGNGWLVLDGTPWDGSRTIFFDAIRLTWNLKDWNTTVDTIYIDQPGQADRHLDVFGDTEEPLVEQDEHGFILYVTNKSLPKTQIDGYYIFKADNQNRGDGGNYPVAWSHDADIHTFGARVVHKFSERLTGRAEFAQQVGDKDGADLCASAFNSRLDYAFRDQLDNRVRIGYEYASGDDPNSGTNEQFDRVWGRWPQFSELLVYPYVLEDRIAEVTNMHRIGMGWSCKPHKKLGFSTDYHLMFADQHTLRGNPSFTRSASFRGQLATAMLNYQINKHINGHLVGEFFFPGNYYSDLRNDPVVLLRYEIVFSW